MPQPKRAVLPETLLEIRNAKWIRKERAKDPKYRHAVAYNLYKRRQRLRAVRDKRIPEDNPEDTNSYRMLGAIIVERLPTLVPERSEIDKIFEEWEEKRDQRVRFEPPEYFTKPRKPEEDQNQSGEELAVLPVLTQDDELDNRKSCNRCLQQSLFLIIQDTKGNWQFPTALYAAVDNLRAVAEHSVKGHLGKEVDVHILGNAPIGVWKYDYSTQSGVPRSQNPKHKGDKVFYFHGIYGDATTTPFKPTLAPDFAWVTKQQLREYLPNELMPIVDDMLIV